MDNVKQFNTMGLDENWRFSSFRQKFVSKLGEVARNSIELEDYVYKQAKTRKEYINMIANLILHIRDTSPSSKQGPTVSEPTRPGSVGPSTAEIQPPPLLCQSSACELMAERVKDSLKAIRDVVSTLQQSNDEVALPIFDPDRNDCGALNWCNNIDMISKDLKWSSIQTAAKAGKALKGSALSWYETWGPEEVRTWEKLRSDIIDAYPERKNLSEKLTRAILFTSDSAKSYSEYAREKIQLLQNTKISFTNEQLIELVCGGICDIHIKVASLNSGVNTTAELISFLSLYVKIKTSVESPDSSSWNIKRPRFNEDIDGLSVKSEPN